MKLADLKLASFFLFILAADIISKYAIQSSLLLHQTIPLIPNFFNITYVENPGAAFGLMANMDAFWRNILLGGVSGLAIVMLISFYRQYARDNGAIKLALVLVLAGAIGNLLDRIRFGVVIDFVDVHWYEYHWPAFNIADSAICIGVGIWFWQLWLENPEK